MIKLINVNLKLESENVLENVNLDIKRESATVIFGRSGSGKTTLLKSIAGLISIHDGQVLFEGCDIAKMDEKQFFKMQAKSGFVFQDAALWANQTIYNNLSLPLRILNPGMDQSQIDARIMTAVDMFNFRDNLKVRPSAISVGEKKIISFLRALMTDPEILFFDEPTTSVDKKNVFRMNKIISELKSQKKTIITVTHDFRLAGSIADNIILIDNGKILQSGSFEEIVGSENEKINRIIEEIKGQVQV